MDPDPNGLYTKRKQQRIGIGATSSVTDSSNGDANKPSVKYPLMDGLGLLKRCLCSPGQK